MGSEDEPTTSLVAICHDDLDEEQHGGEDEVEQDGHDEAKPRRRIATWKTTHGHRARQNEKE